MRILIALVIWLAAVAGAAEVSSVVASSIHHKAGAGTASGSSGGSIADPSSVKATDSASLFRTKNFEHALAAARSNLGAGARLTNVALYPGYLAVTAVSSGGETEFYVDVNGRTDKTTSGSSPGSDPTLRLSVLGAGVPAAFAHRIATKAHFAESRLHYMVVEIDPISHKLQWLAYPLAGSRTDYFQTLGPRAALFEENSKGLQRVR